jgi:hypothetical protein
VTIIVTCIVLLGILVGCRQVVGIESSAKPDGTVTSCGNASSYGAEAACADCTVTSCCREAASCSAIPRCNEMMLCLRSCSSQDAQQQDASAEGTCATDCRSRFADVYGSKEATTLTSCRASKCAGACSVQCGGYAYPSSRCAQCGNTNCCAQAATCLVDTDCAALVACERNCTTAGVEEDESACLHACELARPRGVSAARVFGACVSSACSTSCISSAWRCLDNKPAPETPAATTPTIALTIRFIDYETETPISSLSVRACRKEDGDCTSPLSAEEIKTDADGTAILRVPIRTADAEIYTEVKGEGYGPILLFLPPLAGDTAVGTIPIASQAAFLKLAAPIATPDPSKGTIVVSVRDCAGVRAGGVVFNASPSEGAAPFYILGRLPSSTGVATDDDGFGAGGFVNLKARTTITIQASVRENGLTLQPASVFVRPTTLGYTHVEIYATNR